MTLALPVLRCRLVAVHHTGASTAQCCLTPKEARRIAASLTRNGWDVTTLRAWTRTTC